MKVFICKLCKLTAEENAEIPVNDRECPYGGLHKWVLLKRHSPQEDNLKEIGLP